MIDRCEQLFDEAGVDRSAYSFTAAELRNASLPQESFDGVLALGFLQYQTDEPESLETCRNLLKSGGVLVVSGPNKVQIANGFGLAFGLGTAARAMHILKPKEPLPGMTLHRYTVGRFRGLLSRAGFEVLGYRGHGYGDFIAVGKRIGLNREIRLHRLLTKTSAKVPIGRWGNDLVMLARR